MSRTALALLALSCAHPAPRDPAPPDDCTLATPLQPGVPGSPGHLVASSRNPNGASELATLMRTFVDDLQRTRNELREHRTPTPLWARHRRLRCAWPTDPADRTPTFDAQAQVYLLRLKALETASTDADRHAAFDQVVSACRACHDLSCPGPTDLIEGLRLP